MPPPKDIECPRCRFEMCACLGGPRKAAEKELTNNVQPTNQRDEAEIAAEKIVALFDSILAPLIEAVNELDEVLDRAQHAPPEGGSDNSLSSVQWVALKSLARAAKNDADTFAAWRKLVRPVATHKSALTNAG